MIRITFVFLFLILFLILGIPVLGIEWLIGRFSKNTMDYSSLRIVQWGFNTILKITGVEITVIGEENVPDEPVLFIGNHRSYFDILITYARCKRLTGYIAKKEMLSIPLLSTWMKRLYCLFLDRSNPKEGLKTILQAIDYIKQGISICIFPEGTRNKGEELSLLPFHNGSFKIADKTGCAIIPMSINNTADIFESHFPRIKKTHVILEYGTPIYPKELDKETKKHIGEYCSNIIQETINKNQALL
ncbi:lysophospholipid acyltransferase family protein [Dorea sp. YH-dor226]|uniref:lysophospholipid acyltransferase family protein n=1 Tax=Dorea sp. YH-dor226 TaxID=3151119 RepID=UPI0032422E98